MSEAPLRSSHPSADLLLDVGGRRILFSVEEANRPSAYVRGPAELLAKLTAARPEDRVTLTTYYRWGVRDLEMSGIEVRPAGR